MDNSVIVNNTLPESLSSSSHRDILLCRIDPFISGVWALNVQIVGSKHNRLTMSNNIVPTNREINAALVGRRADIVFLSPQRIKEHQKRDGHEVRQRH